METEKIEFDLSKELFDRFKNENTELGTLARVTIERIRDYSKAKSNGKELTNEQSMYYFYGALGDLLAKNIENERNFDCYVTVLSSMLDIIFRLDDQKYGVLKGKSIAVIKKMGNLEEIVNAKIEARKTKELINILKYVIYSKTPENAQKKITQKSLENLLECTVHSDQSLRKQAFQVFVYMFERDLHKDTPITEKMIEFVVQNLDSWFMKKDVALYTLYFLNSVITFFRIEDVKKVIQGILGILDNKKSSPNVRQMGCLVIEKLFERKHIQTSFTENLLKKLLVLSDKQFYSAKSSEQVLSMVQVLVQVYLNFNRGTPYRSKEQLSQIVNVLAELLTINDEQQTSFTSIALGMIKSHAAKNIELLLIESCDEYLFNPQEEMDLFSAFKMEENKVDKIRENEGLQARGNLKPREKLFVAVKNLCSQRFLASHKYVLQIISSFVKRIEQIEMARKEEVSNFLLELIVMIKGNFEYTQHTQKCLGRIVSALSLSKLLLNLPVRVCQVDMSDPSYEEKSNSYILSLLAMYKTKGLFPHYFRFLWPQLKAINEKIEMQSMFEDSDQQERLMLKNYKLLRAQMFTILKNCNRFSMDFLKDYPKHLQEIVESFLASSKDLDTTEKLAEPLRQALIFIYNNRKDAKKVYIQVKKYLSEKKLFKTLCIANSKVDKNQGFIASLIKIIILMTEGKKVENIFKKNVERLSKFIESDAVKDRSTSKFQKNLRDMDTILLFLESMNTIQSGDLLNGVLMFIQQVLNSDHHLLWKRGVFLAEELLRSVNHDFCPKIMSVVVRFYTKKLEKKKGGKGKKKQVKKVEDEGGMSQEINIKEARNDSESDRKVKDIVTRFLAEYIKVYFIKTFEDDQIKAFADGEKSITDFARKFLPLAILSLKSRSSKTRDSAKKLLLRFDKAYEIASNEQTMLLNLIVAGLAGKTSLMKSSTILSLGLIFSKKFRKLDDDYIQKLVEVILIVIKEKNKETYRSVIAFFKFYVKVASESTLRKQIDIIISALFKWDEASQESERGLVKSLLSTVYRRMGSEELMRIVPENHHKLVKYIEKQDRRMINMRNKGAEFAQRRLAGRGINHGDGFDMDFFERQLQKIMDSGVDVSNEQQGMAEETQDEGRNEKEDLLLKFDSYTEKFHFVKHQVFQIKSKNEKEVAVREEKKEQNSDIYFDEKLKKLIIREKSSTGNNVKRKKDYLDKEMDRFENPELQVKNRVIQNPNEGMTLAAKMLERARKKNTNVLVHGVRESGLTYMAKKGTRGDVKIPGRPNPHAFVQLNPIALQRKYRDRASQVFDFLMSKKKKSGAFKGLRAQLKKR